MIPCNIIGELRRVINNVIQFSDMQTEIPFSRVDSYPMSRILDFNVSYAIVYNSYILE